MTTATPLSQPITVNDVLARLEKPRQTGPRQWEARCPAHDDNHASLSVSVGDDGRILQKCHAGCSIEAICAAEGITVASLFADKRDTTPRPLPRRIVETYDYADERDALLYQAVRYMPKDFKQRRPDGQGGWIWNIQGVRRVPFRLPQIITDTSGELVIFEGEKDARRAAILGLNATTTVMGAGNFKSTAEEMKKVATGRTVYVVKDADDAGDVYAADALKTLKPAAKAVGIITLPRLIHRPKHGEDFSDWLDKHRGSLEELRKLMESALHPAEDETPPESAAAGDDGKWRPTVQSLTDLMQKELPPIRYIVDQIIPEGVTLIGAKPKKGKTTLMMHIGGAASGGFYALGSLPTEKCEVLYLALEDNERRMQKRMRQMLQSQPVPEGFHIAYEWAPLDRGGLDALQTYLTDNPKIGLVVIDTLEHVRPARKTSNGVYADDYSAIRGLQRLAGEKHLAIVPIHHLRKASADDPFDEFNGSEGLMASVDNAIVLRTVNGVNGMLELHRRGRDYEDDSPLAIKGDKNSLLWSLEGKAHEVFRSIERQAIVNLLKAHPEGMTPKEIAQALEKNDSTTRVLLRKMLEEAPPPIQKEGEAYKTC